MKQNLILISLMLGVMIILSLGVVSAEEDEELSRFVQSVVLDGGVEWTCTSGPSFNCDSDDGDSVTVAPSATIEVDLEVLGTSFSNWRCTEWDVVSGSSSGEDDFEPDHTSNPFGIETETFLITAPSTPGTYDLTLNARSSDSCSSGFTGEITLKDAIIVEDESCVITVNPPVGGEHYNDDIPIEWQLSGEGCDSPSYNLHYTPGTCTPSNPTDWLGIQDNVNALEYDWTSGIGSGQFCVRVSEDEGDDFGVSELFWIDNVDPVADANGPYVCNEGGSVIFDGSASVDGESGIDTYEWFVDGNSVGAPSGSSTFNYNCLDGGNPNTVLDVELVVTDLAGNEGSGFTTVTINNVAPVCGSISGPSDIALGETAEFSESGSTDVAGDLPLILSWDFGDTHSAGNENPTSHEYEEAGVYEVVLTVDDGDGGSDTCKFEIEVVEPTPLDDQEVAAFYPLEADFGADNGDTDPFPSFESGLTGGTSCEIVVGPDNIRTASFYDGECRVRWDGNSPPMGGLSANPTNDEQGTHEVIIKIVNGTDFAYFSFDVTVWSWIIDLKEGWNLISIPLVPEDPSIEAVILDQLFDVMPGGTEKVVYSYQFDGEESSWLSSRRSGVGDLDTVTSGYGYWIKVTEDTKLRGNGKQLMFASPGVPPEIEVPTNSWTLIGRYGIIGKIGTVGGFWEPGDDPDRRRHGPLFKSVALESLTKIDNELHVYSIDELDHLVEMNKLFNNKGYWLWIEDEAFNNAESESYAPIDSYYPHN